MKCGTKYQSSRKRCVPQDSRLPGHVLDKINGNLYTFFSQGSFPSSFNRKYVHTIACTVVFVGPARFVCNAYPGRNATCPLSSCSNKNDGHAVALTIFTVACKGPFCVDVFSSFYGRFFVHFFSLLTPPRFGALNRESESSEVNEFTGNCFRGVRIVLKITFLKLRYAGQRP